MEFGRMYRNIRLRIFQPRYLFSLLPTTTRDVEQDGRVTIDSTFANSHQKGGHRNRAGRVDIDAFPPFEPFTCRSSLGVVDAHHVATGCRKSVVDAARNAIGRTSSG